MSKKNTYYALELDFELNPDVSIIIEREKESRLRIEINRTRYFRDISKDQVSALASELIYAAKQLVDDLRNGLNRNDWFQSLFAAQNGLASVGYAIKQEFFDNKLSNDYVVKHQQETQNPVPVVHILTGIELLPWNLLFDKSPGTLQQPTADILEENFWSLNRVVSQRSLTEQNIVGSSENESYATKEERQTKDKIRIGVIIEKNLKYAKSEYRALKKLAKKFPLEITMFRPTDIDNDWQFLKDVNSFLNEEFDIIHMACHAIPSHDSNLSRLSEFVICDRNSYLLRYLKQDEDRVNIQAPLIFLNACNSGVRDAHQTYQFVSALQERGARNVVGIESAMQSQVAEELATKLYEYLFSGDRLGLALYKAKRDLMKNGQSSADILSIMYSLYGNENLRLVTSQRSIGETNV